MPCTEEKFYLSGTTDKYFKAPCKEQPLTVFGQTVILTSGEQEIRKRFPVFCARFWCFEKLPVLCRSEGGIERTSILPPPSTAPYGRLKSPLLLSPLYTSCSIIVHIVLDNIPGNCIYSIVVLCSAGIEFNFIFHSTIIILQLCFCKLYI